MERERECFYLGNSASVFQAETFAAIKGLLKALSPEAEDEVAVIYPDIEALINRNRVAYHDLQATQRI